MSDQKVKESPLMDKVVSLCKRRGFIYQSSEIYGGIGGFWDYGPLGAELKRNLREAWWLAMTREREDVLGLDATIIMHPAIWAASGHVATFADMMRECSLTNKRVRADHVPPLEGTEYAFTGVESRATGWKLERPLCFLLPKSSRPESARRLARHWYVGDHAVELTGRIEDLILLGESIRTHEGTVDFHPETGGLLREARPFNLMLKTFVGPTATEDDITYLRPETAQAIFAQFKNVLDSSRTKVPFGICQIGKAFRNEVTPKNFTFRSREFEQMELEFFIKPDEAVEIICGNVAQWSEGADLSVPQDNWGWDLWHRYWVDQRTRFYHSIGLGDAMLDYHWQTGEELAHYARACVDILFKFPFGIDELEGIAARGDFDLTQHQRHSGKALECFDEELKAAAAKLDAAAKEAMIQRRIAAEAAKESGGLNEAEVRTWFERLFKGFYVPHVIEPSAGLDRLALAVLCAAFAEEQKADINGKVETRTFLRLHPRVAPVKVGVFPLLKNKPELVAKAREVHGKLKRYFHCFYDETAAIGRRYARQDEIGTPFGVTIDFETLGEQGPELQDTVTVRERDSGKQHRVKLDGLVAWLTERLA
ncbi:MAG: glycine--tRNA ligase [Verrucomicrobiales bacterium]|nr:glycine--tRNA ligase [Verrucomicrobiales bacterium]